MSQQTKLTAEIAAAHKAAKLAADMVEYDQQDVIGKHKRNHCIKGHVWSEANTAMVMGKRRCITCSEEKLKALEGSASYLCEARALAALKNTMPQTPFCLACGALLIKGKCQPCSSELRRRRYADMIKQTQGRDVMVVGRPKVVKEFFYYLAAAPSPGSHVAWMVDHGLKAKRAVRADFNVFDEEDDES